MLIVIHIIRQTKGVEFYSNISGFSISVQILRCSSLSILWHFIDFKSLYLIKVGIDNLVISV